MDSISESTLYGWVAAFFAFLPLFLHLMDMRDLDSPPELNSQDQEVDCQDQEVDSQDQEVNGPDPVPVLDYKPMMAYTVTDFEMSIINTLSEANKEMTMIELQDSLVAFWPEADDEMYGTLNHLYQQDILCLREEDGVYLWSVSA